MSVRNNEYRLWELYHENSKLDVFYDRVPDEIVSERMGRTIGALRLDSTQGIKLTSTYDSPAMTLAQALLERRSVVPKDAVLPIKFESLSTIIKMSAGVTCDNKLTEYPRPFRAYPSGGALYPVDIFILAHKVEGLQRAVYALDPVNDALVPWIQDAKSCDQILDAIVHREIALGLTIFVILLGSFERSTFKYGERGYRMTLLEAGHLSQNVILSAVSISRSAIPVAGLFDREVEQILGVDGVIQSIVGAVAIF
jgi:SagB-type dehydrogenase family enzyme